MDNGKGLEMLVLNEYPQAILTALAALPKGLLDTDANGEITIATGYKWDVYGNIQEIGEDDE